MHLKQLSLVNYRNFESRDFSFDNKINCFVGDNGVGKTNILDAIYHLALGKSYFNPIATQNITHGKDFFLVEGTFQKEQREEKIVCSLKKGSKKVIKRNGKTYDRLSEHIGLLPLVIISPSDRDLILEGSETRRKFMDGVISQSNPEYLRNLIRYNKILSQRNSLLKFFSLNNAFDGDTLSVYDEQLHTLAVPIFTERKRFLEAFIPLFREQYQAISGGNEQVDLTYESSLNTDDLLSLLKANINRDRALQYTSVGIHKDDLLFQIAKHPIKKYGSQGQQKSFLIALKFAQFQLIKQQEKTTPILLLDDIFDKLDENRVAHIITLVEDKNFGQIFISDTHPERTENVVKAIHQSYKIFKL